MMIFEEALAAMREGKKVKRKGWVGEHITIDDFWLTNESVTANDWEIYEEPKWEPEGGEYHVNSLGPITTIS